jgi:hypothetical protein
VSTETCIHLDQGVSTLSWSSCKYICAERGWRSDSLLTRVSTETPVRSESRARALKRACVRRLPRRDLEPTDARISHTLDLRARVVLTLFGSSPSVGMLCTSNTFMPGRAVVHSSRHCGAHGHVDPPTHGVPLSPSGCAQPAGPSTSRLHSMSRVHFHAALFKRAPSCPRTQTGRPPASTDSASRFGSRREEEVRVKFGLAFERHRVRVCQEHRECQECRERRER